MADYEDRIHKRNCNLALVDAKYVYGEIEVAIKEWVTDREKEAQDNDELPFRLKEPLSEAQIVQIFIEKLGYLSGVPVKGELTAAPDTPSEEHE